MALGKKEDYGIGLFTSANSTVLPMATGRLRSSMDYEITREEQSNSASEGEASVLERADNS